MNAYSFEDDRWQLTVPEVVRAAAILIPGSGQTSRSGLPRVVANQSDSRPAFLDPFSEWERILVERYVSCLRYDKPAFSSCQGADGLRECMGINDEYLDDIRSAFRVVQSDPRLAELKIYLIGHSLGAIAALYASRCVDGNLGGVVCVALPRFNLALTLLRQVRRYMLRAEESERAILRLELLKLRKALQGSKAPAFGLQPEYWRDYARLHPIRLIAQCPAPRLLLISGAEDQLISGTDWNNIVEAALANPRATCLRATKGDHFLFNNGINFQQVAQIADWIGLW